MKVGIITPSIFFKEWPMEEAAPHLFFLYSYLKRHNPQLEVELLDLNCEVGQPTNQQDLEEFMRCTEALLQRGGYDIIGISCWTSLHYLCTVAVARLFKQLNPEGVV